MKVKYNMQKGSSGVRIIFMFLNFREDSKYYHR